MGKELQDEQLLISLDMVGMGLDIQLEITKAIKRATTTVQLGGTKSKANHLEAVTEIQKNQVFSVDLPIKQINYPRGRSMAV